VKEVASWYIRFGLADPVAGYCDAVMLFSFLFSFRVFHLLAFNKEDALCSPLSNTFGLSKSVKN